MQRLTTFAVLASLLALPCAQANQPPATPESDAALQIARPGSTPSARGPAEYFTGNVRVDALFSARAPSRMAGASVTFKPDAQSAWHTHPVGQVLIVTAGVGRVQREGDPVEEIRPGDVVRIAPGVNLEREAAQVIRGPGNGKGATTGPRQGGDGGVGRKTFPLLDEVRYHAKVSAR